MNAGLSMAGNLVGGLTSGAIKTFGHLGLSETGLTGSAIAKTLAGGQDTESSTQTG